MLAVSLDDVIARIMARPTHAHLLAIDGPSGSGKSTLAARVARRVPGSAVVPIDDFSSWGDPTGATWWGRLEEQVLSPAFAGRPLRYQRRDWDNDELGSALASWRDVPASPLVIVEGVTSARATVRERGAFTMWIDTPAEVRLARGLQRDGESHRDLWLRWMRAEDAFYSADRTAHSANLRVDGNPTVPHDPETQLVSL